MWEAEGSDVTMLDGHTYKREHPVVSTGTLGKMRGSGLVTMLEMEQDRVGIDALAVRTTQLPPVVRRLVTPEAPGLGLSKDDWYDAEVVHALVDLVVGGMGDSAIDAFVAEAARRAIENALDMRPTYASLESPERVTRLLNAVWRAAFSDGALTVLAHAPNRVEIGRRGWTGHHRVVCRFGMQAVRALYEATGARDARVSMTGCVSDGASDCRATVEW